MRLEERGGIRVKYMLLVYLDEHWEKRPLAERQQIYLGQVKVTEELQARGQYLAGWDVCLLPFALNEATRFISPTKTLEYLAAGRPVVSTAIADVAVPYGEQGLVRIARDGSDFIQAVESNPFAPVAVQSTLSLALTVLNTELQKG